MKPRRQGSIREYQNGHWFLYITEWEETTGASGRKHTEIEVYYAKAEHVMSSDGEFLGDPEWNTTDPNKLEEALKIFMEAPERFRGDDPSGKLPEEVEVETQRQFPVHSWAQYREEGYEDCPKSVPWAMLYPNEIYALDNHGQTLDRLAERGGLCPKEMTAILKGRPYRAVKNMTLSQAIEFVNKKVEEHNSNVD